MVILTIGEGWHDLESSKDGPFFWSSNSFSLYIEIPLLAVELYVNCNKVRTPYKIKYSTDNWNTEEIISLETGINVLNIFVNGKKRIDFKCDYFIPSQITQSSDNRKLGVQLFKTLCKSVDNNCYDLDLTEFKSKFEIESKKFTGEINSDSFKITLGSGWHDLEEEKFRWSDGCGVLHIKDGLLNSIRLNISSPISQTLIVKNSLNKTFEIEIEEGNQCIFLNVLKGVCFLELKSGQYTPPTNNDSSIIDKRKLGIQLYSIEISLEDFESKTYLTKHLFFQTDHSKLMNFFESYNQKNKLFNFNSDGHVRIDRLENNKNGKFNLNDQTVFYTHRSGWAFAINSIKSLHSDEGIKFEGFLERMFSWEKYKNIKENLIPIKHRWVGVIHNPLLVENNKDLFSTSKLLNSIVFQKSLDTCKGLYVLSNDLKEKIKNRIGNVPVEFCYHPTETPNCMFTMQNFLENPEKKVISLGSWARKFLSIFLLNVPLDLKKCMIEPTGLTDEKFKAFLDKEKQELNSFIEISNSVETIGYQTSKEYDFLLSRNIMFMDFHDISASNLIIECIVRNTPLLVKKHNAVIDYLGEGYPFYFETLHEASEKINDKFLIEKTYNYLVSLETKRYLTGEHFLNSIKTGKIYASI